MPSVRRAVATGIIDKASVVVVVVVIAGEIIIEIVAQPLRGSTSVESPAEDEYTYWVFTRLYVLLV